MNIMRIKLLVVIIFILAFTFLAGCSGITREGKESVPPLFQGTQVMMDTPVTIMVYDKNGEAILKEAFEIVNDIENKMSINMNKSKTSEVIAINRNAGKSFVKVSDETFEIIKKGKQYSELSGGKFDITVGPLVKLWGIGTPNARVPSSDELKSTISLINYRNILFDESNKSIMLKNPGMVIDLGGIAKGYTADVIADFLKSKGVKHAIVNLGGNVMLVGGHPKGRDWVIGLQDPFNHEVRGASEVGKLTLSSKTIVTSGVYERYFEANGKRYHHILSPFTGYPVENDLVSLSIITDVSANADALSTSVFSMGLEEGMKFVQGVKGVDAIFVTKDKKVYTTSGIRNAFKITNSDFKLQK